MKKFAVLAAVAAVMLGAGCASDQAQQAKYKAQADAYRAHASQARAVNVIEVTGDNVAWSITGATRIAISQPVDPLSQMDREPTGGEVAVDIIEAIAPIAPYAAMVGIAANTKSQTTRESRSTYVEKLVEPGGDE